MQSVALSLLRFTFFQSERLHKNTTTFKEIYTEIEDIQDIDTHFILFFVGKKCSRSIKAFLRPGLGLKVNLFRGIVYPMT